MTINALRDIKFLRITKGRTSVRNALLTAHDPDTQLDLNQPAYIVTSQLRLLAAVTAVALRHTDARVDKLRAQGLEQAAIDAALEDLSAGCDPFDATYPFMQRPVVPAHGPKDAARKLGPGEQPVKSSPLRCLQTMPRSIGTWRTPSEPHYRLPMQSCNSSCFTTCRWLATMPTTATNARWAPLRCASSALERPRLKYASSTKHCSIRCSVRSPPPGYTAQVCPPGQTAAARSLLPPSLGAPKSTRCGPRHGAQTHPRVTGKMSASPGYEPAGSRNPSAWMASWEQPRNRESPGGTGATSTTRSTST